MRKGTKIAIGGASLLLATVVLTGCTASFCDNEDKAHILYVLDYGVTAYYSTEVEDSHELIDYPGVYVTYSFDNAGKTFNSILTEAAKQSQPLVAPSLGYWAALDSLVLRNAIEAYKAHDTSFDESTITADLIVNEILDKFGYLKFYDDATSKQKLWANWDSLNAEIRKDSIVSIDDMPSNNFITFFKTKMETSIANYRSCITTKDGEYGYYGVGGRYEGPVNISAKSWGDAWSKGLLEGLLIYPISWLIDQITFGLLNAGVASGVAQLLGILFITIIIRGLMLVFTFKQTAMSTKMSELQPEMAKIQAKYPNANTNQHEKMRLAEETQKLYKKHKINPFTSIITMFVQFPVFICVWGALSGSAILSTGNFLGLNLSDPISSVLFNGANWSATNLSGLTALILFLLMAGSQVVSMLLPQWLQKRDSKNIRNLGKNPAKKSSVNKMKIVTYVMMAMIIVMGFTLASGMGVYWFVGALISIAQTLIMRLVSKKNKKARNK